MEDEKPKFRIFFKREVERVFSLMIVKSKLPNSMGDQLLNDCLVTYRERDLFFQVSDDDVINRFQSVKGR